MYRQNMHHSSIGVALGYLHLYFLVCSDGPRVTLRHHHSGGMNIAKHVDNANDLLFFQGKE